jgi:LAO/AO transport system kinase
MNPKSKNKQTLMELKGVEQPKSIQKFDLRRTKTPTTEVFVQHIHKGNISYLSRAITLIESTHINHQEQAAEILQACLPLANNSIRIGITGVPGVGKSTFIEALGNYLIEQGKKVAVLAIDPSSSINKGSIMGDKTRMEELVKQKNAYIRPSPSGDSLGGVARKTREAIILCEAAGFDTIIVETVGVGQSETAVHSMVDFFVLLKLAGAGDELQGIKRGIMEMADAIVINKADGTNLKKAKLAKAEFERALHLYPPKISQWQPKVSTCSAIEHTGIIEVWDTILSYIELSKNNNYFQQKRDDQNKYWVIDTIDLELKNKFYNNPEVKKQLKAVLKKVQEFKLTPFEAAKKVLSKYYKKSGK